MKQFGPDSISISFRASSAVADNKCLKDLEEATMANNLTLVKSLVEMGNSSEVRNSLQTVARLAATKGHRAIFEYAVRREPTVLKAEEKGETVAHVAAKNGRREIVAYIAEVNPSVFADRNDRGETVLYLALKHDIIKNVRTLRVYLEEKGVPLTELASLARIAAAKGKLSLLRYVVAKSDAVLKMQDYYGNLAHIGAVNGHPNIVRYLAQRAPYLLAEEDRFGNNVFHLAARHKCRNVKMLKFLEEKGVSLTKTNIYNGKDVAFCAAENGNVDVIRYIEEKDPRLLEKRYRRGETVVHVAARSGSWNIVRYMAQKNAKLLTTEDDNGNTILHTAAFSNNLNKEALKLLLEDSGLSIPLNETNSYGRTVADIAVLRRNLGVIKYFGERMPSLLVEESLHCGGSSPLHRVVFGYPEWINTQTLKLLVENCGPLVESRNNITFAQEGGSLGSLEYLMAKNPPTKLASQALHEVISLPRPVVLKYLIEEKKTDVNVLNERGEPPTFTAVRQKCWEIFEYLVAERNSSLTMVNDDGENILYVAVARHDLRTIEYVLDVRNATIDLEWRNKLGDTVLHAAVRRALDLGGGFAQATNILEYLVERKRVNLNARGHEGKTCLHHAALRPNIKICNYLREQGADSEIQDASGHTYWDYATFNQSKRFRRGVYPVYDFTDVLPPKVHERIDRGAKTNSFQIEGVRSSAYDWTSWSQLQNFLIIGKWISGKVKWSQNGGGLGNFVPSPLTVLQSKINAAEIAAADIIRR